MEINFSLYQKATKNLIGELLDRYGVDLIIFKDAPIFEQAKAIHQLFGYNYDIDIALDEATLIDRCEEILYFYESAIHDGTVPENKTQEPFNLGIQGKILNLFESDKSRYLKTFKDCLIPANKEYKMKAGIFDTLKDCLVSLLEPIPAVMDMEKFWDEAIKFSWQVKVENEKIPF